MGQANILLRSNRLSVEVAHPGTVYRGTRFDWTGFITQVTLDGQHTFCQPESLTPGQGTGGIGLCNEFGIEKALGYAEAQPGDLFPKPGIGLLKKPDAAPYFFMRPYALVEPFPINVQAASDRAVFTVEPVETRGYALRQEKVLSLDGNQLLIEYTLVNTGRKPVITHEYTHNFIGIDHHAIGPGYRLDFPYRLEPEDLTPMYAGMAPPWVRRFLPKSVQKWFVQRVIQQHNGVMDIGGSRLTFHAAPTDWFYCRLVHVNRSTQPQWDLVCQPAGAGLREFDDFEPARVVVWGTQHVVSAEVFIDLHLMPGESMAWSRRYEFF